jgi:hypothetical protein
LDVQAQAGKIGWYWEMWKIWGHDRGAYNALGALHSTKEPKNFNKVGNGEAPEIKIKTIY